MMIVATIFWSITVCNAFSTRESSETTKKRTFHGAHQSHHLRRFLQNRFFPLAEIRYADQQRHASVLQHIVAEGFYIHDAMKRSPNRFIANKMRITQRQISEFAGNWLITAEASWKMCLDRRYSHPTSIHETWKPWKPEWASCSQRETMEN